MTGPEAAQIQRIRVGTKPRHGVSHVVQSIRRIVGSVAEVVVFAGIYVWVAIVATV